MSTFSDKFDNHWKCIPYAMATLTSSDGFMILFHRSGNAGHRISVGVYHLLYH